MAEPTHPPHATGGFEPVQQEQMVLQYVWKHGVISRDEVAQPCRITSERAYRLLKKPERRGRIAPVAGSTKEARYGRARD